MLVYFLNRRSFRSRQNPKSAKDIEPEDTGEADQLAESSNEKCCWWIDSEFAPYTLLEKYKEKTDTTCDPATTGKKGKGKSKGKRGSGKAPNPDAIALEKVCWILWIWRKISSQCTRSNRIIRFFVGIAEAQQCNMPETDQQNNRFFCRFTHCKLPYAYAHSSRCASVAQYKSSV